MTFLAPWAFWFLAGVPVIIALHLLRVRRQRADVPTLMFWQRVLQENRRRALFQRLRHPLSLLLHLLIFLLIVCALARPAWEHSAATATPGVLILDARQRSQAATAGAPSRFDRARQALRSAAAHASPGRELALVVLRDRPEVVVPFTGDARRLREAVAQLAPSDCAGSDDAARQFAADLLAGRATTGQILFFDGRTEGDALDNAAITRLAVRAVPASPQTCEVLLEAANFSAHPLQTNIALHLDGRLLDVKPVALAPGGRFATTFPVVPTPTLDARGWLTARLEVQDALEADNRAFAVLPRPAPLRVLLVSPGNFFLEKALAANPLFRFELLAPSELQPALAGHFDVVIFDGPPPGGWTLEDGPAGVLFLGPSPFDKPGTPTLDRPLVTGVQPGNPLLRMVNFEAVTLVRARALHVPALLDGWRVEVAARSFDHPLVLTAEKADRRAAAFAFDLAASDLPLRVAFPLLIANTLHWLGGARLEAPPALQAGAVFVPEEGTAICPQVRREFDAAPPAGTDRFSTQPVRLLQNGFYATRGPAGTGWIAVNTFSAVESNLRAQTAAPGTAVAPSRHGDQAAPLAGWPPWKLLAGAALALLACEWVWFHRRVTE